MIRELMDLQHRLQEAENLIQRLEDQLQSLIDKENSNSLHRRTAQSSQSPEIPRGQPQVPQYSYGARYATGIASVEEEGLQMAFEPRDAAYCIGREGACGTYRRPV